MTAPGESVTMLPNGKPIETWSAGIRVLHWTTVVVLSAQFFVAFALMGPGIATLLWLPLHLSLGVFLLTLTVARLLFRTLGRRHASTWPAQLVHSGLYLALLLVTATGWLAFKPAALMPLPRLFGLIVMPRLRILESVPWTSLHRALVWTFIVLVAVHLGAAALHSLILRDGTFRRMSFGRVRTPTDQP